MSDELLGNVISALATVFAAACSGVLGVLGGVLGAVVASKQKARAPEDRVQEEFAKLADDWEREAGAAMRGAPPVDMLERSVTMPAMRGAAEPVSGVERKRMAPAAPAPQPAGMPGKSQLSRVAVLAVIVAVALGLVVVLGRRTVRPILLGFIGSALAAPWWVFAAFAALGVLGGVIARRRGWL